MTLENKKILMVVAPTGFKDEECFIPKEAFEKERAIVRVASMSAGFAKSKQGQSIKVDFSVDEVKPANFDAVVFIGGSGMGELVAEPSFVDLARDFHDAGKLTAAICIAPVILANAGVLSGKPATVHESAQSELEENGALFTGEAVTKTDNIITANGPAATTGFAKAIIDYLK
jgi:protease I